MKLQALLKSAAYVFVVFVLLVAMLVTVGNGMVTADLRSRAEASKIGVGPIDSRAQTFIGEGILVKLPSSMSWEDGVKIKKSGVLVSNINTPSKLAVGQRVRILVDGSVVPISNIPKADEEVAGYGTWQGDSATIDVFTRLDVPEGTKVRMYHVPGDVKIIWAR